MTSKQDWLPKKGQQAPKWAGGERHEGRGVGGGVVVRTKMREGEGGATAFCRHSQGSILK